MDMELDLDLQECPICGGPAQTPFGAPRIFGTSARSSPIPRTTKASQKPFDKLKSRILLSGRGFFRIQLGFLCASLIPRCGIPPDRPALQR